MQLLFKRLKAHGVKLMLHYPDLTSVRVKEWSSRNLSPVKSGKISLPIQPCRAKWKGSNKASLAV